ncbi:hypothetical protein Tco_0777696 [Tanacetum coccineum]
MSHRQDNMAIIGPRVSISLESVWGMIPSLKLIMLTQWRFCTSNPDLIILSLGKFITYHQRSTSSPFQIAENDLRLGNLKFVPKGEEDEVFGMPIPNELISNNIRNASYYNAYLEMVAKHDQKVATPKEGKKKSAST